MLDISTASNEAQPHTCCGQDMCEPCALHAGLLQFIMIYRASKSLNGPSDLLAGVVSGPRESIEKACHCRLPKLLLQGQHDMLT